MSLKKHSICLLFICFAAAPTALCQQLDPDQEGCKDSALITRMPGCMIRECSSKDFEAAKLIVARNTDDEVQAKELEGKVEVLEYQCPERVSQLQIVRNMEGAAKTAGYTVVFSGKGFAADRVATVKKGGQWIEFRAWDNASKFYRQTAVKVEEMTQEVQANADAWAEEISKNGRVAIYGINFETGKAAVMADSEKVLAEVAALMNRNPEWKFRIEGHTDNVGAKALNQTLSQQRAASVVAWLAAHGVEKARLSPQGFGDSKPVADNASEEGRAKNRRVELVKIS